MLEAWKRSMTERFNLSIDMFFASVLLRWATAIKRILIPANPQTPYPDASVAAVFMMPCPRCSSPPTPSHAAGDPKSRQRSCRQQMLQTMNDSPQPHCSSVQTLACHQSRRPGRNLLMLGFLNTKRSFSLSSTQSISLPMILKSALLSISTLTPSCSTASSKAPGLSTYSRWYAKPEQPLFFTPTRMSFGSGNARRSRR